MVATVWAVSEPTYARRGPFEPGDLVQLTDSKGRMHTITLVPGKSFHTHRGSIEHDAIIGAQQGCVLTSTGGTDYLALKPLLDDFVLAMPRGAAVIYPKDAARIIGLAGIGPGGQVAEAGVGSGALTCSLLRAVGPTGQVHSVERRPEFAEVARRNVRTWFGCEPAGWTLTVADLADGPPARDLDALILEHAWPRGSAWPPRRRPAARRGPGRLRRYHHPVVQAGGGDARHGAWTEPRAEESLMRTWHPGGLSVRPDHRMNGHTGFLVAARRLAPGTIAPVRRRRPAPTAYGEDYAGPRATPGTLAPS
jgi:tRNA (adenine57-N1/adenine58-N1)-methyltransferase